MEILEEERRRWNILSNNNRELPKSTGSESSENTKQDIYQKQNWKRSVQFLLVLNDNFSVKHILNNIYDYKGTMHLKKWEFYKIVFIKIAVLIGHRLVITV